MPWQSICALGGSTLKCLLHFHTFYQSITNQLLHNIPHIHFGPNCKFGAISPTGSWITIYGNFTKCTQLSPLSAPTLAYMSNTQGTLLPPHAKFQVIGMTSKCNIIVLCSLWIVSYRISTWNCIVATANWIDPKCFSNNSMNIEWNDLKKKPVHCHILFL